MKTSILKNSSVLKLIISQAITRFGDSIETIIISVIVYELTNSYSLMGITFMVNFIPNLIFAPFAGVIADRYNRKYITVISDFVRAVNAFLIAVLLFTGVINIGVIIIFQIINSTFETFASPARQSLIADIVPGEDLVSFNGYYQSITRIAELVGLSIAALIVVVGGYSAVFLIDAITFILSGVLILSIAYKHAKNYDSKVNTYFKDIKLGFKYVKEKKLALFIILFAAVNFFFTPLNILLPAYCKEYLNDGVSALSQVKVSLLLGIIAGGFVVGKVGKSLKISVSTIVGLAIIALSYFIFTIVPLMSFSYTIKTIVIIATSFIFGSSLPFVASPVQAYVFQRTESERRGVVSAIMSMLVLSSVPLGGALVGLIGNNISISTFYFISSCGIIILTDYLFLNKEYRTR